MAKDRRYTTVKNLITGGYIKTFIEIFDTIPKSVVAHDLGFNSVRMTNLMNNVDRFILKDVIKLASLIEVDTMEILKLIYSQYVLDSKIKRKK
ncbi:hypothetical protein ABIE54_005002 [Chitinophagaceae bacterium OAS944]